VLYSSVHTGYLYQSVDCKQFAPLLSKQYRFTISSIILLLLIANCCLYCAVSILLRQMRLKFQSKNSSIRSANNDTQLARERRMLVTSCWLCGTFVLGWLPACVQVCVFEHNYNVIAMKTEQQNAKLYTDCFNCNNFVMKLFRRIYISITKNLVSR
jgi:hypothetical protein